MRRRLKKAAALAFALGALFALWFFWLMKKPQPVQMEIDKSELVHSRQVTEPKPSPTSEEPILLQEAKKKNRVLPLGHYPQKKMVFDKSHLWILQGITASAKKRHGEQEVARLNQYYIYQTPSDELQNIVYDDLRRQYGVLTFEITVVAQEGVLSGLAQKYGLEVLREGPQGAESILRSDTGLFFSRDLPSFEKEEGVVTFRPYVSYGTAKFR